MKSKACAPDSAFVRVRRSISRDKALKANRDPGLRHPVEGGRAPRRGYAKNGTLGFGGSQLRQEIHYKCKTAATCLIRNPMSGTPETVNSPDWAVALDASVGLY